MQVIHAAVSYDEGVAWSGFRELYRDPHMAELYKYGDHGTAYPEGKEVQDGTVILSTGQVSLMYTRVNVEQVM